MWKVKKISSFLSPSCGCKARETMATKCELVVWGTSTENISLQSSYCNILGYAATVALFAKGWFSLADGVRVGVVVVRELMT